MNDPDMYVLSCDSHGKWIAEDFSSPTNKGESETWKCAIEEMEKNYDNKR